MAELGLLASMVGTLVSIFVMLVIVQFVIGLLFAFNVVSPSNDFLRQIYESINRLLEPVLRPVRRVLPDTGAIDFSPLVVIIVLSFIQRILGFYGG